MHLSKYSTLIFAVVFVGCSGSNEPSKYPVNGKVVFRDGKPVTGFTVKFRTTDRTPPVIASGKTDDQGQFRFRAAEGENAAVVVPSFPRDTDTMTPAERDRAMNPIDSMFLNYDQSRLKFQVTTDPAKNQFEIKVWPPAR